MASGHDDESAPIRVLKHEVLTEASPKDPKRTSWKLVIEKPFDSTSVRIHRQAAEQAPIPAVELVVQECFGEAGLLEVARYELKDARLGDRQLVRPRLADGTQLERFALRPAFVRITLTERAADGALRLRSESTWTRGLARPR